MVVVTTPYLTGHASSRARAWTSGPWSEAAAWAATSWRACDRSAAARFMSTRASARTLAVGALIERMRYRSGHVMRTWLDSTNGERRYVAKG